jgi:hypothetical protein
VLKKSLLSSGGIFLMIVLTLATLGISYGLWSKNLVIHGVVETGDLNADWDDASTNDPFGTLDPFTEANPLWPAVPVPKDVGSCDIDTAGIGTQIIEVTLSNVYPSYECTVTGLISNTGTIPFNIIGGGAIIDAANAEGIELLECTVPAGVQVDPINVGGVIGEEPIDCTVHVKQTAQQGWTYYFAIEACVAQWNEDPSDLDPVDFPDADFEECKNPAVGTHEGPDTPTLPAPHPTGP